MSDPGKMSVTKRALVALQEAEREIQQLREARTEPIAIVGAGCRIPGGADSPRAFWTLLEQGFDALKAFPPDRHQLFDALGVRGPSSGGFLPHIDRFDAPFFSISPREAISLDPAQRLLLEVTVEALEDAGVPLASLRGSNTGTFLGFSGYSGYGILTKAAAEPLYTVTGLSISVAAGRIPYVFDFHGPSLAIDTACSSAMVSVHLACESLRSRECDVALAGSANIILTAFGNEVMAAALSTNSGRCRTFDAAADGYVRSEGCGVVVLKRLRDAIENGDRILGLIAGSAVHHDGQSNGLTAPNGVAQAQLIRAALAASGIDATQVDYVETHGTGTPLGDPVELDALAEVFGRSHSADHPLTIGSVKTNVGHTEGAAGVVGLLKVLGMFQRDKIPAHLHFENPNPRVRWDEVPFRVPRSALPWASGDKPRVAGVSSFGFNGTISHAVVMEPPRRTVDRAPAPAPDRSLLLPISAKTPEALRAYAASYAAYLDDAALMDISPRDIAGCASLRRDHYPHRLVVLGRDRAEWRERVALYAAGGNSPGLVHGVAPEQRPRLAFVFCGQGPQAPLMGKALFDREPAYREALVACDDAIRAAGGFSVIEALHADAATSRLDQTEVAQPALFAVQFALTALWASWGVIPDAVVGHSIGEVAAAVAVGALTLRDAARLVVHRGRIMQRATGLGKMLSVALPLPSARAIVRDYGPRIAVGASNSPTSTVLSGDADVLNQVAGQLAANKVETKWLPVEYAFHSEQMKGFGEALRKELNGLPSSAASGLLVSTVTGAPQDGAMLGASYWAEQIQKPVLFSSAIESLVDRDCTLFLEIGPHPVLSAPIAETLAGRAKSGRAIPSLRRERDDVETVLEAFATLHCNGFGVDWKKHCRERPAAVPLPTYPWQREPYWLDASKARRADVGTPEETHFWEAVEKGDLAALRGTLRVDDEAHRSALATLLPTLSTWRRRRHEESIIDSWRYRVVWKALATSSSPDLSGTWLVVTAAGVDEDGFVPALTQALTRHGASVAHVRVTHEETDRAELAARLRRALPEDGARPALRGVLSLAALDETPLPTSPVVPTGLGLSLALVQALGDAGLEAPLWLLTRGAVSTSDSDPLTHPRQAMAWGLGRVVALEHPERWGGLIDLGRSSDAETLDQLASALGRRDHEDQLALRPTGLFARRLVRAPLGETPASRAWRPQGTVLITGGTGALGAHVARWLAAKGAAHLVLTSRRGPDAPGASELRNELAALGANVTVAACDIADRRALERLFTQLEAAGSPVHAVVHTGGVGEQSPLAATTVDELTRALSGKVGGAQHLHDLLRDRPLDAFVLFSSGAGIWGGAHQAGYAAANAFLDALAEERRALGLAATSIAWGTWGGGGMADDDAVGDALRRRGLSSMAPALAISALEQALDHGETTLAVAEIDWARFAPAFAFARPRPLLSEIPDAQRAIAALEESTKAHDSQFLAKLLDLPDSDRQRAVLDVVRAEAATVLGLASAASLEPHRPFRELGLDSLMAVELRNRLAAATGLSLKTTLLFDYPTPAALARFCMEQLLGRTANQQAARVLPVSEDEPIAIVAMSCRYPGGASTPEDLWRLLRDGQDAISAFPENRGWNLRALDGSVREGGFVEDADRFDPAFFGISPRETVALDPQQRLLLETSWEVLERAGIDPASLQGSPTGVFIGIFGNDYAARLASSSIALKDVKGYLGTGSLTSVASGRIAYTFGFEGPAVSVDTACSSSLTAIHLASQALRRGECSLALAGGVTVMATPGALVAFDSESAGAPDGRCKSFSAEADGAGWAEGAGVLLLERLSDALQHGHPVLAVIKGSAVNQDGRSQGLTAPNGPSQERVIRQALESARLAPRDVDVVEAHGTGTRLGDPIEAEALLATYGRAHSKDDPLWLGSVKSNVGHTQAAAGVAGVIKMVLAMHHGVLPKTLHAGNPSPHVDWSAGTVRLLTEPVPWKANGRPRRAAVSSFGVSGTNAHVILEEAPASMQAPAVDADDVPAPLPFLLSAKTGESLRAQAARLREHLTTHPSTRLVDVASSLATTRACFDRRAAIVAGDRASLEDALDAFAQGRTAARTAVGVRDTEGKVVFVFSGQGSQWAGMALPLLDASKVFRDEIEACDRALAPHTSWSLLDVLRGVQGAPDLARVDVVQPVHFAVLVALAALWRSFGVVPDAVVGHSQGEIAAACVAGALSREDAAKIVALRSRAITRIAGRGAMAAVELGEKELASRLARFGTRIALAAVNSPRGSLVSGEPAAIEELLAELAAAGIFAKKVRVDYASHSAHVDAIEHELTRALTDVRPREARVPMVSTVTGETLAGPELDAAYWYRNLRQKVRFAEATEKLLADGHRFFVEVSPHPVLALALDEIAEHAGRAAVVVGSLRRDEGDLGRMLLALGELHTRGLPLDWKSFFLPQSPRPVALPTYPFQRERFWLEGPPRDATTDGAVSAEEADFWRAVDKGDLDALARALHVDGGPPRDALATLLPTLSTWHREKEQASVLDSWRYRVVWKPLAPGKGTRDVAGTWLFVVPEGAPDAEALAARVGQALTGRGAEVVVMRVGHVHADRARLVALLRATVVEGAPVRGVLSLLALDEAPLPTHPVVPSGLALVQTLVPSLVDAAVEAPLWLVTRGAISIGRSEPVRAPIQAFTWGLGRVVGLEHPERWGGLLDLEENLDEKALERLLLVLAGQNDEDQLALRATGIFVRRLVRAPLSISAPKRFEPRGTILITGGTGALGAHVARWLARNGAEHLVLTSRRGPEAPDANALRDELAALGPRVSILACDLADRDAVKNLIASLDADDPPLRAVFHVAGVSSLASLSETSLDQLAYIVAGKARGAQYLHESLGARPLDAFVFFSSIAGVWGSSKHAGYAAANAYLDALAEHRRAEGSVTSSIAWGVWGGGGMIAQIDKELALVDGLRRRGLTLIEPPMGIAALKQVVEQDDSAIAVADIDWARFAPSFAAAGPRPLLRDLPEAQRALEDTAPAEVLPEGALATRLRNLSESDQLRHLVGLVLEHTGAVLGHADASRLEAHRGFFDLGLDSLMGVELRKRLQAAVGFKLPATLIFDHPSAQHVAAFLRASLAPTLGALGASPDAPLAPLATRTTADEPIAIVGLALRFPGGIDDRDDLWDFLVQSRDAVAPIPRSRWNVDAFYDPDPDTLGKSYVRDAALLDRIDLFDAPFFAVNHREARYIDPQHRLLLETAWEALEDAGVVPASLKDSSTGVFVGIGPSDYGALQKKADAYSAMGTASSFAAGRVAFTFGLQGPAISVDTACSASLVALHLACQSLRKGECHLALAAGVQLIAGPGSFEVLSRTRALAPDGRCKTFSANADGMGRGEGVVVLALERLADARARGHEVLALVRGSAVNHDGASTGITAPNGTSQQKVLRAALADAGLRPSDIDMVECHGTGTSLGDPIEIQALAAVYGADREADRPLLLGALKPNIGHLEAASGLAGVAKVVAAMRHGALPPSIHSHPRNHHIDWDSLPVEVVDAFRPWAPRADGAPRRAGVSAFGLSGTNAHVILEEAPVSTNVASVATDDRAGSPLPFMLSAKTEDALHAQAARLREHLAAQPDLRLVDIAASLATARSHFEHRAVVVAPSRASLGEALDALVTGRATATTTLGVGVKSPKLAFLFTGQGGQRPGMGRSLYEAFPAFRDALDAACARFDATLARPLRDVLFADDGTEDAARLDQTAFTQPALFALEVALFRLLEIWGVKPQLLLGHSVGEIVAAHVAGVLSLDDACTLVAARAKLMDRLPAGGAMVTLEASEEETLALVAERPHVAIAALNGDRSTVISGDEDAVLEVAKHFASLGRKTTRLRVSHAFHSPRMDAMLEDFRRVAEGLTFQRPRIPIVSNLTGTLASEAELCSADYWVRHVRHAVRFADGVRTLRGQGVDTFLELGPHGVLSPLGHAALDEEHVASTAFFPVLRKDRPEADVLLGALGALHVRGVAVDWSAFFGPLGARRVPLPTYAFQRERFWLEAASAPQADVVSAGLTSADHPLLGAAVPIADTDGYLFTGRLALADSPWLAGHALFGMVILSGTAFVELALVAAQRVGLAGIEELTLEAPLVLPTTGGMVVQVSVGPSDARGLRAIVVHSRPEAAPHDAAWTRHAVGVLGAAEAPTTPVDLRVWPPPGATPVSTEALYPRLAARGLGYSEAFQGLRAVWKRGDAIFAEVHLPDGHSAEAGRFLIHPALLDAALHALALDALDSLEATDAPDPGGAAMPFAWSGVSLRAAGASMLRMCCEVRKSEHAADIHLADAAGSTVGALTLFSRPVTGDQLRQRLLAKDDALLRVDWRPLPDAASAPPAERWVLLGPSDPATATLDGGLAERFDDLAHLLAARGDVAPPRVLVACTSGGARGTTDHLVARTHDAAAQALALLQAWLADERLASSRLVILTVRAVAAHAKEDIADLAYAPLWGMVRTAQAEHPERALVLVDTDDTEPSRRALAHALASSENQLALRDGKLLVPRLARSAAADATIPRAMDPQGTVLVTGGTGTLGALVARHLVQRHGVTRLLLISRRGLDAPGAASLQRELEGFGATVTIASCDAADRAALEAQLASVPHEHPLSAVVHTAGTASDSLLAALTPARLHAVLRAKVDAAWNLHELTQKLDLAAFVLYSSVSGVLGGPGQANYAAANVFLDALAQHRRSRGLPGLALAWGFWAQASAITAHLSDNDRKRMTRGGILALASEEGLALFDSALGRADAALVAARMDLTTIASRGDAVPSVLRGLATPKVSRSVATEAAKAASLEQRLASLSAEDAERALFDVIRSEIGAVLALPPNASLDPDRPLQDLGLDSLVALELRNRLAAITGLRLHATVLFDHPTPKALVALFVQKLVNTDGAARATHTRVDVVETTASEVGAERVVASGPWAGDDVVGSGVTEGPLFKIFREASERGAFEQGWRLLSAAAELRITVERSSSAGATSEKESPVRFTTGPASPKLVCFPSFMLPTGPIQYARFASHFKGKRDVWVIPHSGYRTGQSLTRDAEEFIASHARTVLECVGDSPFVLLGGSAGGLVAQMVAEQLERIARGPVGVVLLDSFVPNQRFTSVLSHLIGPLLSKALIYGGASDAGTTAMCWYNGLTAAWKPRPLSASTLHVRAREALKGRSADEEWRATWELPHAAADVPGNHFTMIEQAETAELVESWLSSRTIPSPR